MISSTIDIAWRNLGRNRRRTALALTAIAVAQLALLVMDGLMHGYTDAMIDAMTGPMLGHAQVHAPEWREERAMDLVLEGVDATVAELAGMEGVERVSPRLYAPALAALGEDGHTVVVVGLDATVESGPGGMLAAVPARARPRGRQALVGRQLARKMGVSPGDEIAIVGQAADGSIANDLFVVSGVFSSPVDLVNRLGIVVPLATAQDTFAMPDQAHEITIRGNNAEGAEALAAAAARLPELRGAEVLPWQQLAPELITVIELSDASSAIVLLLVFVAAAAGVANTMLMATFERTQELGMLLALGTTPRRIVRMIVAEAIALGLAGVAVGTVLGTGAVLVFAGTGFDFGALGNEAVGDLSFGGLNYGLRIYPRIEAADIFTGVWAVVVTALLASLWPAIHAARLEPVKALRS